MSTTGGTTGAGGERRRSGFRRRDALHQHTMHFGPNMTPMVDVVMVILIFFMASAAFLGSEWFLNAALPFDAGRGVNPNVKQDPLSLPPVRLDVVLDVEPDGSTAVTFLDLRRGTLADFEARLSAFKQDDAAKDLEVVIRPNPRVRYGDIVRVHSACDRAGLFKVGIARTPGR
jgi:biopolymer transport protein ExbD